MRGVDGSEGDLGGIRAGQVEAVAGERRRVGAGQQRVDGRLATGHTVRVRRRRALRVQAEHRRRERDGFARDRRTADRRRQRRLEPDLEAAERRQHLDVDGVEDGADLDHQRLRHRALATGI